MKLIIQKLRDPTSPLSKDIFRFENSFEKLNYLMENLSDLKKIFDTAVCFQNIEKLEMGGLSGKILSEQMKKVKNKLIMKYSQPLTQLSRSTENSASSSLNGRRFT